MAIEVSDFIERSENIEVPDLEIPDTPDVPEVTDVIDTPSVPETTEEISVPSFGGF